MSSLPIHYSKSEISDMLLLCLQDDIEIACETFEEATGKEVKEITWKRIDINPSVGGKTFEYQVGVKT